MKLVSPIAGASVQLVRCRMDLLCMLSTHTLGHAGLKWRHYAVTYGCHIYFVKDSISNRISNEYLDHRSLFWTLMKLTDRLTK